MQGRSQREARGAANATYTQTEFVALQDNPQAIANLRIGAWLTILSDALPRTFIERRQKVAPGTGVDTIPVVTSGGSATGATQIINPLSGGQGLYVTTSQPGAGLFRFIGQFVDATGVGVQTTAMFQIVANNIGYVASVINVGTEILKAPSAPVPAGATNFVTQFQSSPTGLFDVRYDWAAPGVGVSVFVWSGSVFAAGFGTIQ